MIVNEVISDEDDKMEFQRFVKTVLEDCQPWLKETKGEIFYRGMKRKETYLYNHPIHTNRKPRNTPQAVSDVFNKAFHDAGFEASRNNSIFIEKNVPNTMIYGSPFMVFPVGDFSYTWSNKITDLFGGFADTVPTQYRNNMFDFYTQSKYGKTPSSPISEDLYDHIVEFIKENYYSDNILQARSTEIMVHASSFHAIHAQKGTYFSISRILKSKFGDDDET